MELAYAPTWLTSPRGRPISLSLPFNLNNEVLRGDNVAHYFEGLLPDSDAIRRRVAARFKTGSLEAYDLLAAIGRDCVGALQLLPDGEVPAGVDRVDRLGVEQDAAQHRAVSQRVGHVIGEARDGEGAFALGLAVAADLAKFGCEATVFEALHVVGGDQHHTRTARVDLADPLEVDDDVVGVVDQVLDRLVGFLGGAEEQRAVEFYHDDALAVLAQQVGLDRGADLA